ncbi:uncharacterized protein BYT42DRAFT_528804 [Radiomyces spectabilis]|uniref:uncharacterized protein n=1 Tax=Radiomyces spectabilis TaxID=64574 RepID=UPI0022204D1A|nr:uncharacterized protein BYT42DRAFT_528804 [Radiomyces spectabilis]KAI8388753.1 hypothetical protein BYT42DRAFT_528804 [Radiomyces spectabilis]
MVSWILSVITLSLVPSVFTAPFVRRSAATVYHECTEPGKIALTLDDGPFYRTWELGNMLSDQGVKATFFINGNNWVDVKASSVDTSEGVKSYMEVLKHLDDLGHQIGSHTYEHRELGGLSTEDIHYQMETLSSVIEEAIGKRPAFMRPPAGSYDDHALEVLGDLGYHVVMWNVDSQDWVTHDLGAEKGEYEAGVGQASGSYITLQHEVFDQTIDELIPWIVNYGKEKQLEFVTVAECLGFGSGYH